MRGSVNGATSRQSAQWMPPGPGDAGPGTGKQVGTGIRGQGGPVKRGETAAHAAGEVPGRGRRMHFAAP